jgi:hypothetical protein
MDSDDGGFNQNNDEELMGDNEVIPKMKNVNS